MEETAVAERRPLLRGSDRLPARRRPDYLPRGSQLRDSAGITPDFAPRQHPGIPGTLKRIIATHEGVHIAGVSLLDREEVATRLNGRCRRRNSDDAAHPTTD